VIVIDASLAVKWFVTEEGHATAVSLLEQNQILVAPDLIFPETTNVFWKKLQKGEMTSEQSQLACRALPGFLQGTFSSSRLSADALKLAIRLNHSVYDCIYLACAEQQGAKLVTADKKFVSRNKSAGLHHLVMDLEEAFGLVQAKSDNGLSISDAELTRVLGLSDQFRRTVKSVEDQVGKPIGSGTLKLIHGVDLAPAFDSPSHRGLRQALGDLSFDELYDIVALAWLGRGLDGHDWLALHKRAEELLGNRPLEHEGYIISLFDYVRQGIETLTKLRGPEAGSDNR